mgnify:FL=1
MKSFNIMTKRFCVRKLKLFDVNLNYLQWFKEKEIQNFIGKTNYKNISELKNYFKIENKKKDTIFLGIFTKQNNQHIGNIKFYNLHKVKNSCELGIMIGNKNWRNKSVAYETLVSCLKNLKKNFLIKTIYLGVEKKNHSAVKLYKKIGFNITKIRIKNHRHIMDMEKIL